MNNIKIFKELLIEYIKENEDNERNKKKIDAVKNILDAFDSISELSEEENNEVMNIVLKSMLIANGKDLK